MKKLSMFVVYIFLLSMVGFSAQVGAYDEVSLKKLNALGNCPSCDLSKALLYKANLEGADLTGANLKEAIMYRANLEGSDLSGAILCNTTMPDGSVLYSGC